MNRRPTETKADPAAQAPSTTPSVLRVRGSAGPGGLSQRRVGPRSRTDVEERYVAARDVWTAAMKTANSGKTADLASLAIAQEAFEAAAAERQRWEAGGRVAIAIEPDEPHRDLGAVVGQELAWRAVHSPVAKTGFLGRIARRFRGK